MESELDTALENLSELLIRINIWSGDDMRICGMKQLIVNPLDFLKKLKAAGTQCSICCPECGTETAVATHHKTMSPEQAIEVLRKLVCDGFRTFDCQEALKTLEATLAISVIPRCPLLERVTEDHYHCKHNIIDVHRRRG